MSSAPAGIAGCQSAMPKRRVYSEIALMFGGGGRDFEYSIGYLT